MKPSSIHTLLLLLLLALPLRAGELKQGDIVQSKGDGTFDTKPQPDAGFPIFSHFSLKLFRKSPVVLLLEGVIVSDNTGGPIQGVKIYVQHEGEKPYLFAMSNADGKIKMTLRKKLYQNKDGHELRRVFIGDPVSEGSFTRVYPVTYR